MFEKKKQAEFKDSIDLMLSEDYKDRFKAEYMQLKIRYDKLQDMLADYLAGKLKFGLTCPYYVLRKQLDHMAEYLGILEVRAQIEGIDLNEL